MGILMGLATMAGWGIAIFFEAVANRKTTNFIVLFWMELFGLLLGSFYLFYNFSTFDFSLIYKNIIQITIIALLQMFAYLSFYKGLKIGQVSLVSSIAASWGLLTALLGIIFLKEVLKINQTLAIIFIISGIILSSINIEDLITNKKIKLLIGVREGLMAMFGWGTSLFLLASLTKTMGWFLPAISFRFFLLIFLFVYMLFAKKEFVQKKSKFPLWLLILIGVFDMGAFFTFSLGTSGSLASIVAPIGSAYALVTIILAKIFFKEKIKPNQYFGIAGILTGLILISL
ncbi:DMT family transporter [Candidatus Roizmanbacteria bacterium]|nr:DMT family transporter [Candidatus Roizmanbacteria bacterium]